MKGHPNCPIILGLLYNPPEGSPYADPLNMIQVYALLETLTPELTNWMIIYTQRIILKF